MIVETIVGFFVGIIEGIVGALPADHLSVPSFGPAVGLAMRLDGFLPVHEVVDFTLLTLQIVVVIFGFKFLMFVVQSVKQIPFL